MYDTTTVAAITIMFCISAMLLLLLVIFHLLIYGLTNFFCVPFLIVSHVNFFRLL